MTTYKFRDVCAIHPHLQFVTVGDLTPENSQRPDRLSSRTQKRFTGLYVETEYEVEPLTAAKVRQEFPDPQERQKEESGSLAALRSFFWERNRCDDRTIW